MAKEIRRCTKAETKDARRYAHEVLTNLSIEMKKRMIILAIVLGGGFCFDQHNCI